MCPFTKKTLKSSFFHWNNCNSILNNTFPTTYNAILTEVIIDTVLGYKTKCVCVCVCVCAHDLIKSAFLILIFLYKLRGLKGLHVLPFTCKQRDKA